MNTSPTDLTASSLHFTGTWRKAKNVIATVLMGLSFCVILVPLALVLGYVVSEGLGAMSIDFLTEGIPTSRTVGPGMGPAIVGTIVITTAATLIAVPLGILGAVYLHEYGGNGPLARLVRFLSYVMTGVPSIVMGLFIYTVWVLRFKEQTGLAGALALACLMLPVVIRSAEEMLRLVPNYLREASYALGTSKSRTILTVVLPAALPGITSGSLLAVARAAGETAPLLFTIGIVTENNWNLFSGSNTALSAQIFVNAQQPFAGAQERAYGAALTLVALAFGVTFAARVVAARFSIRER